MKAAPPTANEPRRLEALRSLNILDSLPENEFNDIVAIASQICDTPIALVSFVDQDRQWFKAKQGLDASETSREIAFCAHAIHGSEIFVVEDATKDSRFADNPLVLGALGIRFYAGAPLINHEGLALGTLCVIDQKPKKLSQEQLSALRSLSRVVMRLLESRTSPQKSSFKVPTKALKAKSDAKPLPRAAEEILSALPAGVFVTDEMGSCIYVNENWCKMAGLSSADAMGDAWSKALHPEDRDKVFAEWKKSAIESRDFDLVYRFLRPDETVCWVHGRSRELKNESGETTGFLGALQDVTDLQRAEEFNSFYKMALDAAAIVAFTDPKGKIIYANEMFCQISGYERSELLGMDHRILNSGKMSKEFFKEMWLTISKGRVWRGEICNRAKNGSEYWVDTAIVPHLDSHGKPDRYIAIRKDITKQKLQQVELAKAYSSLEDLKTRLEVALDGSNIGVWEWKIKSNTLIWDDRMFTIYGQSRQNFSSAYDAWVKGVHPDDFSKAQQAIDDALGNRKPFNIEFRVIKENGEIAHVMGRAEVLWDSEGSPETMLGINWDITEIKKNEFALEEAKRIATESAQAKGQFLANMSHEIRTPINGVIGFAELLNNTKPTELQKEYLDAIQNSADGLLTIINDILDFSKVDAGKIDFENVDFNLSALIQEVEKMQSMAASRLGTKFEVSFPKTFSQPLYGDPTRIKQVLLNLLSNAIKFSPQGKVQLCVQIESEFNETFLVRFLVIDSGVGIPKEAMNRMFQAFSQADATTSKRFGGTGLGLSISKKLVTLMGGRIGVESTEGVGSRFWFELPLKKGQCLSLEALGSRSKLEDEIILSPAQNQRILVVEDNQMNQKIVLGMLQKLGYRPTAVGSGDEAIDALRQFSYDLILMDCQMPGMDGFETTKIIRSGTVKAVASIPIVALTANALKGDREKCLQAGMSDYLSKPLRTKELGMMLIKYLSSPDSNEIHKKSV